MKSISVALDPPSLMITFGNEPIKGAKNILTIEADRVLD